MFVVTAPLQGQFMQREVADKHEECCCESEMRFSLNGVMFTVQLRNILNKDVIWNHLRKWV